MNDLRLVVVFYGICKRLCVQLQALRHLKMYTKNKDFSRAASIASYPESPTVLGLSAEVEINFGDQQALPGPGQPRRPAAVGRSGVAGAVKVSKVLVGWFSISRGELVGESFRAHAIYGKSEVAVGDGCVSRLNWPQWLAAIS